MNSEISHIKNLNDYLKNKIYDLIHEIIKYFL